jgi:hypothetical protein
METDQHSSKKTRAYLRQSKKLTSLITYLTPWKDGALAMAVKIKSPG